MAVGDTVSANAAVAATTGTMPIRPAAGIEWVIDNIVCDGAIEIWKIDTVSAVNLRFDTLTAADWRANIRLRCTNAQYYEIRNTSGSIVDAGYDGIVWK